MSGPVTGRERAIATAVVGAIQTHCGVALLGGECGDPGKDGCGCVMLAVRAAGDAISALDAMKPDPEGIGWLIEAKAPADSPLAGASLYLTLDGMEPSFGLDPNQAIRLQRETDAVQMARFFKIENVTAVPFLFGSTAKRERTDEPMEGNAPG